MDKKKGFTLLELLIVVGIIGILAVFLMPAFVGVRERAKEAGVRSVMHTVQLAVESYNLENMTYPIASNISLKNLFDNYLTGPGYLVNLPKNPFTGKPYTESDTSGKVVYDYDTTKNTYKITGYKKNGSTILQELTSND